MKKIKIEQTDGVLVRGMDEMLDIQEALDAVNGNATAFTLAISSEVYEVVLDAINHLNDNCIPPSDWTGAKATYTPAGPYANAYKNSAISTQIMLSFNGGSWALSGVERVPVYPRNPKRLRVTISDRATTNAVRRLLKAFGRTEMPMDLAAIAA
jgi:hypothetical protein